MNKYYNGTKLLKMKDLNGDVPEIYICTSNRSAGKTTFFNKLLVDNFFKDGKKFLLICRHKYEVDGSADAFFNDIQSLFFPDYCMIQKRGVKDIYDNLYIGKIPGQDEKFCGELCGYVLSLTAAEKIKRRSHLLSDVSCILYDEFMSEQNDYLSDETSYLFSIHRSLARGHGEQRKYLPVYLVGNLIDKYNPYYEELGISSRLIDNCNFLRGNGWVLEQGYNAAADIADSNSAFSKAFSDNEYSKMSKKEYLKSDSYMIQPAPGGASLYIATIRFQQSLYAVRLYIDYSIYYISSNPDPSYKGIFAARQYDLSENSMYFPKHKIKDNLKKAVNSSMVYCDSNKSLNALNAFILGK